MRYRLVFRDAELADAAETLVRDQMVVTFDRLKLRQQVALEFYEDDSVLEATELLHKNNIKDFSEQVVEDG